MHRLPDVKSIVYTFVGPELEVSVQERADGGRARVPNCEDCVSQSRTTRYLNFNMKYEAFKQTAHFQEPDLVLVQNCGFSEFSDEESYRYNCRTALFEIIFWRQLFLFQIAVRALA